jgi:hypothetical protein
MELFVTTGNSAAPFARVDGGAIPVGLVAAHIEWGPSFVFIGKRKGNDYGIFLMGSGEAQEISTPAIEEILATYTAEELSTAYANRFFRSGVDVVTFHLPNHVIAFYGEWADFRTGTDEAAPIPWIAQSIIFFDGEYLVGTDGMIGTLTGKKDLDQYFAAGFDTFARSKRGSYFQLSNLELDCLTGQEPTDYTVSLSLSRDNRVWSQQMWRALGTTGNYQKRVNFNGIGGLGLYESFCGIRVRSTANVTFAIDSMQAVIQ